MGHNRVVRFPFGHVISSLDHHGIWTAFISPKNQDDTKEHDQREQKEWDTTTSVESAVCNEGGVDVVGQKRQADNAEGILDDGQRNDNYD